jgi:tRNA(Ile)-lysidine synthase
VSVAEIRESVRGGGLLAGGEPLLVLLSGGRDSVCLLDLALALRGREDLFALHLNYGLRAQADEDERHCAALCESFGVELSVVHAEAREASERGEGNVQAWARELRYAAAARLAEDRDALFATGHTASDQVETILYRLAASPGRRALQGMAGADGRLVRPLLGVTRAQTAAYCEERGLSWREDASNEDERFARARVRARLVPALRTVHPAAEANVLRTAKLLREETELLDGLVDRELAGERAIALERLAAMPAALARMVVVRLAEQAVGELVPQAGDRVQELLALAHRGGSAELHVGGRAGAVIERGVLAMRVLPPRAGSGGSGGGGVGERPPEAD